MWRAASGEVTPHHSILVRIRPCALQLFPVPTQRMPQACGALCYINRFLGRQQGSVSKADLAHRPCLGAAGAVTDSQTQTPLLGAYVHRDAEKHLLQPLSTLDLAQRSPPDTAGVRQPEPGPCQQAWGLYLVVLLQEIFVHRRVQCVSVNSHKADCAQESLSWKKYQIEKLHFSIQWLNSCQLGSVHG